jgi:hypothetical protein
MRKIVIGAIVILALVLVCTMGSPARIKKEMCIDANVYSANFGTEVPCS